MSTEQQNIESTTNSTDVATEATNTATNSTSTDNNNSASTSSTETTNTTAPSTETTSNDTTASTTTTTTTATTAAATTTNNKRKETDTQQPKYIETRIRKKAREALDLISNTKQRQASLFNLLGNDYTGPTEQQLEMIFRLFSRNGKTIGADELKSVIRAMGKRPLTRRIDKILNECDENGNGTIEMDEFVRYMQKKAMEKAKTLGLLGESDEEEEESEGGDTDEEKEDAPKKKAANAKPKAKKSTKKSTTTAAATTTTTTTSTTTTTQANTPKAVIKQPSFFQPIKKGSSIVHYYTENAGTHINTNVELDQYSNPKGVEHDLGVEGAFTQFTILIGIFYDGTDLECIKDLKSKGFQIVESRTQKDFIEKLPQSDIALIISGYRNDNSTTEQEFTDKVEAYHKVGKGLFIWNDNTPYILQGNWITNRLYGVTAAGNEPGKQDLTLGNGLDKQHFSSHLVTSGIVNLYEGITISSFADITPANGKLEVLASSSQGNKIMLVSSTDPTKVDANCGRVVVDSGFTKLFAQFFSAGTSRYVKNCCVWLLALDHRFRLGVEVSGEIEKPKEVPVWQYLHGTWNDYDNDASKVVEDAYQEWLTNPYTDVRSVKSGAWAYQIDFKQNKQTNIQHFAHTTRDIRRVLKNVVKPTIN
ncbi:hypothetical protein ACTA71_007857 [Dictyostelium dimigraforme]